MKRNYKSLIPSLIICLLLIGNVGFGANFSDLSEAPWAVTYINKMADLGVISGYLGKFNPNDNLGKYAAISTIYRTLEAAGKLEDESIAVYKAKHSSTLSKYNVPDWEGLHEAVAYFLEKGIIKEDELNTFIIGDEHQNITRSEVSVYLGKALNLYIDEEINTFISLNFKDANMITTSTAPYVNLLVEKGIVSGTPEGYFKPYEPITRAAMTKMLSDSYDILKDFKVVELEFVKGTISYVLEDPNKIIVTLDGKTDSQIYTINDDVEIQMNDIKKSFDALKTNQEIKLGFDGTKLLEVEIVSDAGDVSGEIRDIEDRNGYFRIELYDENDDDDLKTYLSITGLNRGTLDGNAVSLSEVSDGDYVKLTLNSDDRITKVDAESKYHIYEGILKSNVTFNSTPKLKIEIDNGDIRTFELDDEDVDIERNDRNAELSELVVGDYVKIKTAFDKIVDIEAEGLNQSEIDGRIKSVLISDTPLITIIDDDGNTREFKINPTVEIEIDNDDAEYYDLRVNYDVEMELDGNTVIKIDAEKRDSKDQISGSVSKVYKDLNIITVIKLNSSGSEHISVTYNDDTEFLDSDGDDIRASNLDDGDTVFIYGQYLDSFFIADKVILLD